METDTVGTQGALTPACSDGEDCLPTSNEIAQVLRYTDVEDEVVHEALEWRELKLQAVANPNMPDTIEEDASPVPYYYRPSLQIFEDLAYVEGNGVGSSNSAA